MTQKQLCEEVSRLTGLKLDSSYMVKVLNGQRRPPRVIEAIKEILEIADVD